MENRATRWALGPVCFSFLFLCTAYGATDSRLMKDYRLGSDRNFKWFSVADGIRVMKQAKLPGIIHYYDPKDERTAARWSIKTFKKARERLDAARQKAQRSKKKFEDPFEGKIVFMMASVKSALPEKYEKMKLIPRRGTGIVLYDFQGNKLDSRRSPGTSTTFLKLMSDAIKKNAKLIKKLEKKERDAERKRRMKDAREKRAAQARDAAAAKKTGLPRRTKETADEQEPAPDPAAQARLARMGKILFEARCGECHDPPREQVLALGKAGWEAFFATLGTDKANCTTGKLTDEQAAKLKAFIFMQLARAAETKQAPAKPDAQAEKAE